MLAKCLTVSLLTSLACLMFAESSLARGDNKRRCQEWCNANKPRCVRCWDTVGCGGTKYKRIESFKRGGDNWYACGLTEYGSESRQNKAECEAWCRRDERCEDCRDTVGCGVGRNSIKMFGGRGENWYACASRDRLSQLRRQECDQWCEANRKDPSKPCIKCSSASGCGRGYKVIKRFRGEGENWNACTFIASREECESYCGATGECAFCSDNPGCGSGYTSMKTFRGISDYDVSRAGLGQVILKEIWNALEHFKKNWYACKKR